LEGEVVSIFRGEDKDVQEKSMKQVARFLLGSFFDFEAGGENFLRNVG
jgi:hypothetical protein